MVFPECNGSLSALIAALTGVIEVAPKMAGETLGDFMSPNAELLYQGKQQGYYGHICES